MDYRGMAPDLSQYDTTNIRILSVERAKRLDREELARLAERGRENVRRLASWHDVAPSDCEPPAFGLSDPVI